MFYSEQFDCNPGTLKEAILEFISSFENGVLLDSNSLHSPAIPVTGTGYHFIAGAGIMNNLEYAGHSFADAGRFIDEQHQNKNWLLGYISYDVKNEFEKIDSLNPAADAFPTVHFFVPAILFIATNDKLEIRSCNKPPAEIFKKISNVNLLAVEDRTEIQVTKNISKEKYIETTEKIISHIQRGDIYELNYCCEIIANCHRLDPVNAFRKLNTLSPNPFACFYRQGSNYLLCASPERFLKKTGDTLLSQPMKGTAPRSADPGEDERNRQLLMKSEKERSENVMIVDLVRNDLSRVAAKGSVKVNELFGVYAFTRSHQMISTISCTLQQGTTFYDIIKATFPMGSMTGAPKVSAMKLIDRFEDFKRGIFSGSAGYIDPGGNFDLNVIIRSIRFNAETGIAAFTAGGAITADSDPGMEYNEMMLKMSPQLMALGLDAASLSACHA